MSGLQWFFQPGVFTQTFMVHAYIAGTVMAVISAIIGVFVVMKRWTFVAHALPKIGFAGASGAVVTGLNPLLGVTVFTLGGALTIGNWTRRGKNDILTALTLVLALGTGALFLSLSDNFTQNTYALLFGQIVGISLNQVLITVALGLLCSLAMAVLYRPLLLSSIQPEWAEARGLSLRALDITFLVVAGTAAALTVPIVGVLLNFSMLVAPAAAGMKLAKHPRGALFWSLSIGVGSIWLSLILSYDIGWPAGFFVATITTLVYLVAHIVSRA